MGALVALEFEPPSVNLPEPDQLAVDEGSGPRWLNQYKVSSNAILLSNELWQHELFFGETAPISREIVLTAVQNHPDDAESLKRWWKAYQIVEGHRDGRARRSAGGDPSEGRPGYSARNVKCNEAAMNAVLDDARKFRLFMTSRVPTLTIVVGKRLVRVARYSNIEVARLIERRTKASLVKSGVTIQLEKLDPATHQLHHKGTIACASLIVKGGSIMAVAPLLGAKVMTEVADKGVLQVTNIDRRERSVAVSALEILGQRPTRGFTHENIGMDRNSELFALLEEAVKHLTAGSRSIFKIAVFVSDTMLYFATPETEQRLPFDQIGYGEFDKQLQDLTGVAQRKLDERLMHECFEFLGVSQADRSVPEEREIAETLFRVVRDNFSNDIQHGWNRLVRIGLDPRTALSEVTEHYGVKLLDDPDNDPDEAEATSAVEFGFDIGDPNFVWALSDPLDDDGG
jgi:ribosomal protein L27